MQQLNYTELVEYHNELHYALEREFTAAPIKLKKLRKVCKELEDQCRKCNITLPPKIQYKEAV